MAVLFSRKQLFARGARGGPRSFSRARSPAALADSAAAAPIPDADLAYARLLVGAELLALDFYAQAIAAKQFGGRRLKVLKRALFNEQEHYAGGRRDPHAAPGRRRRSPADFDFSYPKGSRSTRRSRSRSSASTLETTFLGAYLGAVDALQTNALKQPVARIAASEAEHLSVFTRLLGGDPVGISFPDALTIDEASDALDAYTS